MRRLLTPSFLSVASIGLILFFVISMVWTYAPIAWVELSYQSNKVLHEVFHANSLQELILPNIDLSAMGVKNRKLGMQIPSLYLDEPIIFNVDPHDKNAYTTALKKGIAHAAGTDLPGYEGLGYYFAHSSEVDFHNQYNAVFYLLGKLKENDEVILWQDDNHYNYRVRSTKITSPNDVSFLNQTYERPTIVLQTCWPPGTTQKRLLIFAERE